MLQCRSYAGPRSVTIHPTARIINIAGKQSLIAIGDGSHILGEILVFAHGGKIEIGCGCYVGEGVRIWSAGSITIGDRVLISHHVNIFDSDTHPLSASKRRAQFQAISRIGHPKEIDLREAPVVIGNDAWLGAMAIVLKGVTIGEGAIVGAGSVVTRDVPPWTIVAGNPAKAIRELSPDER
jgi:acetyltransferase-like isoleucine patch superfamily enzyme